MITATVSNARNYVKLSDKETTKLELKSQFKTKIISK